MAEQIDTGGGSAIRGSASAGGNFSGRDSQEVNINASAYDYRLADLRIDILYQKQELARLREDLNLDRQSNAAVRGRIEELHRNLDFLDEQVQGMLLLKPAPQTPLLTERSLNLFLFSIFILFLLTTSLLVFFAWGR